MYVWLPGHHLPPAAGRSAKWSATRSLILGAAGQVAYHLMVAAGVQRAHWLITTAVACLPVAVLGMGAALAHLVRATPDPELAQHEGSGDEHPADAEHDKQSRPAPRPGPYGVPGLLPDGEHRRDAERHQKQAAAKGGTAAGVARLVRRNPALTTVEIAVRLNVHPSTVRRARVARNNQGETRTIASTKPRKDTITKPRAAHRHEHQHRQHGRVRACGGSRDGG